MITYEEAQRVELLDLKDRVSKLEWQVIASDRGLYRVPHGAVVQLPNEINEGSFPAFQFFIDALMRYERLLSIGELFSRTKAAQDIIYAGPDFDRPPGRIGMKDAEPFYRNMTRFVRTIVEAERKAGKLAKRRHSIEDRIEYGDVLASSYVVAVHIPLDGIPEPLGRRVSTRLVKCFHDLEGTKGPEIQPDVWSAELCDAAWKLFEEGNATDFKVQASPDPIVPGADKVLLEPIKVPLRSGQVQSALLEASAALRGLKATQDAEVTGIPFRAENRERIQKDGKRTVLIHWKRRGGPVQVEVELDEDEFKNILPFVDNGIQVTLEGFLEQKGNRWTLTPSGRVLRFD